MQKRDLYINDYTYDLPPDRIASHPLAERDASRLLIYQNEKITECLFRDIDLHLHNGALLVFNNTRVVEARLLFQKPGGATIEIFCLGPSEAYSDISTAISQTGSVDWQCLVGGFSKWKHGQGLEMNLNTGSKQIILSAQFIAKKKDAFIIRFSWQPSHFSFAQILHAAGAIPLPPYIKRKPDIIDVERYQTIYAQTDGSVAAPTAGLHFTETVFKKLSRKGIIPEFITLHVGAGTFKPVKSKTIAEHEMHAEWMNIPVKTIENILLYPIEPIIAVGTTTLRCLESLYWLGLQTMEEPNMQPGSIQVSQWEPYEKNNEDISTAVSLTSLVTWMKKNELERLVAKTQICIVPGYKMKLVKGLVTNFHQPQSTLLLLVAAFTGKHWLQIYSYALANGFRFLSYGDACLLWSNEF